MERLMLLLLSVVVACPLGATAQIPDILKVDGKTYSINTNPLVPVLVATPDRLPKNGVMSTALWRGYIGSWSIREDRLWLDDVRVPTEAYMDADAPESKQFSSAMKHLFDDSAPRIATWFTGHLIVPTGEMVEYVHMGYGSTYSSYLVVTIVKGVVQERRNLDRGKFEAFRRTQYQAYKKTPEYAKALDEVKQGGAEMSVEETDEFLSQFTSGEYLSRIFER
jgi:hypothetical protein